MTPTPTAGGGRADWVVNRPRLRYNRPHPAAARRARSRLGDWRGREVVLGYAVASHCWRAIPVRLAEWAWQRRGRSLIERAARSVPAYSRLLRIFSQPADPNDDTPRLETCRRSYVEVFPLEQRCRQGWQRDAVSFEPFGDAAGLPIAASLRPRVSASSQSVCLRASPSRPLLVCCSAPRRLAPRTG